MTKIAISGATGRMGRVLIQAVSETEGFELGAAIARSGSSMLGADAGELAGVGKLDVAITDDLKAASSDFDVLIDFTRPEASLENLAICREAGKRIVIGTTGFDDDGKKSNY